MAAVSLGEFESLLTELGHDEFVAFVADLWAARGLDTTASGNMVTGSTVGGHESVRVRVWHQRRISWWNLPILPKLFIFLNDLAKVDVFVTNSDSNRLRRVAETAEARYVGPERLRTFLLYGIERKVAEELFRRHFDRPLETDQNAETTADRTHTTHDFERHLTQFVERILGETTGAKTVVPIGIVAIALVFAMVVFVGLPGRVPVLAGQQDGIGDGGPQAEGNQLSRGYPPGINSSGLANSSVLTAAHANALENRTYRLTMHHDGTRGLVVTRRRWQESRQQVLRRTPDQYRYTVDGELVPKTIGTSPDTVWFGVEIRSSECTGWTRELEMVSRTDPCGLVMSDGTPSFARATSRYLDRYLGGKKSTVRTVKEGNRTLYRVVVTGVSARMSVPMSNYKAVVLVEESGFVREFSVTYETPLVDQSEPVSFSFRFEDA